VELELDPEQPAEVARTVAELLAGDARPADPWWQAGVDESLAGGPFAGDGSWWSRPAARRGAAPPPRGAAGPTLDGTAAVDRVGWGRVADAVAAGNGRPGVPAAAQGEATARPRSTRGAERA
jgi:hypothetical protein